jgi:carbonyl reductase 1
VKHLALQYTKSSLNKGPFLLYLTARDESRGETALATILDDATLRNANVLAQDGGLTDIKYHRLDISDSASIKSFAEYMKSAHPDGVDFVINNAGIALDGFGAFFILSFVFLLDLLT